LTTIDVPGAVFTQASGINDAGQIVGMRPAPVTAFCSPAGSSRQSTCPAPWTPKPLASTPRVRSSGRSAMGPAFTVLLQHRRRFLEPTPWFSSRRDSWRWAPRGCAPARASGLTRAGPGAVITRGPRGLGPASGVVLAARGAREVDDDGRDVGGSELVVCPPPRACHLAECREGSALPFSLCRATSCVRRRRRSSALRAARWSADGRIVRAPVVRRHG
jgi:hypothetical protein